MRHGLVHAECAASRLATFSGSHQAPSTISHPAVSTSLVGCRNVAEVEDNAGAIGWSISDEDRAGIDAIFARHDVNPVPDYWIEDA